MKTKDIEEIVEEVRDKVRSIGIDSDETGDVYIAGEDIDDICSTLRTTLTQHHQAEVERGVKKGKIQALHIMEDLYAKADDKADLMEMVNEAILTPTKTDEQYPDVPCAHGIDVNKDCTDCAETMKKLVFKPASDGFSTPTTPDKQ